MALAPEDVLVCLAEQLGATKQDRLFRLTNLLEFFRCYHGPIDWNLAAQQGRLHGAAGAAGEGLSIASEIIADNRCRERLCSYSPTRFRSHASWNLHATVMNPLGYTGFKAPFYFSLSLLSIRGFFSKCRYLFRSMVGNRELKPILPRLIYRTSASLISTPSRTRNLPSLIWCTGSDLRQKWLSKQKAVKGMNQPRQILRTQPRWPLLNWLPGWSYYIVFSGRAYPQAGGLGIYSTAIAYYGLLAVASGMGAQDFWYARSLEIVKEPIDMSSTQASWGPWRLF